MSQRPWSGADTELLPLLDYINKHPDVRTVLSCAGHFALCHAWVHQLQTCDDSGTPRLCPASSNAASTPNQRTHSDLLTFDEEFNRECVSSSQPMLMFRLHNASQHQDFIHALRNTAPSRLQPVSVLEWHTEILDEIEIVYGYSDADEGYSPQHRLDLLTSPCFALFWQHFASCWHQHMNKSDSGNDVDIWSVELPNQFPLNLACYQCSPTGTQVPKGPTSTPVPRLHNWINTELFEEEYLSM